MLKDFPVSLNAQLFDGAVHSHFLLRFLQGKEVSVC